MSNSKYYTGIGTRAENLPKGIESLMVAIGQGLAKRGYTLRSGAASGADSAFETGCLAAGGSGDIYLPWPNFRHRRHSRNLVHYIPPKDGEEAYAGDYWVHSGIIPHFFKMNSTSRAFHGRNYYQVSGRRGEPNSLFVVYYAPMDLNDEPMGGTRSAVMRAMDLGIPVYNLGIESEVLAFENTWR